MRASTVVLLALLLAVVHSPAGAQSPTIAGEPSCCDYQATGFTVRICVPLTADRTTVVRGLMVHTGDHAFARNRDFRDFAARFGFGTAAGANSDGTETYAQHAGAFFEAFKQCGTFLGHPELEHAPITTHGCSYAGGAAYGLAMYKPERTVAFVPRCPVRLVPSSPNAAQRAVPGMFIVGGRDRNVPGLAANVGPVVARVRAEGGLWSKVEIEEMEHCKTPPYDSLMRFLETAIELRVPPDANPRLGPVALRAIAESAGWLADDSTWDSGNTLIATYQEYAGDKRAAQTSWLIDRDLAFLHRALTSRQVAIDIAAPNRHRLPSDFVRAKQTVGDVLELRGDANRFPQWDFIELFEGSSKVAEVRGGGTTFAFQIPLTSTRPIAQAFHVIAHGHDGSRKPSRMYDIVVKPAVTAPPGDAGASGSGGTGSQQDAGAPAPGLGGQTASPPPGTGGRAGGRSNGPEPSQGEADEENEDAPTGQSASNGCNFVSHGSRSVGAWFAFALALATGLRKRARRR